MKYKELVLRRMESIENRLKRLRSALNERNVEAAREILKEIEETNLLHQEKLAQLDKRTK